MEGVIRLNFVIIPFENRTLLTSAILLACLLTLEAAVCGGSSCSLVRLSCITVAIRDGLGLVDTGFRSADC